jgi:hypothetical protein
MKCYRIREQYRVSFLMASQLVEVYKKYDVQQSVLNIRFCRQDGKDIQVLGQMTKEELSLFELRWERFHASDELFFDCVEFQGEF